MARDLAGVCDAVVFYPIDHLSREDADFHSTMKSPKRFRSLMRART